MNETQANCETRLSQLKILNDRVNLYASKLWQIPFAYLATVFVAFSKLKDLYQPYQVILASILLIIAGCIAITIVWWHNKKINTLISKVTHIEESLGLESTMGSQLVWHFYALIALCIGATTFIAIKFYFN